jgi:hypothetical protein
MRESELVKIALFRIRELAAQIEVLASQATSDDVRETLRSVTEAVREQEKEVSSLERGVEG